MRQFPRLSSVVVLALFALTLANVAYGQTSVTIAGSLQSELGCTNDWDPSCTATDLAQDPASGVWIRNFNLPTGNWEYKAALDHSWNVSYGKNTGSDNISLNLANAASVLFLFDNNTQWITDNVNSVIATVPGSYQSELGCPGDWQPDCLVSWLQDPSGSGTYSFTATLPAGNYEAKVAHNLTWDVNYGAGGVQNGANIQFTVQGTSQITFTYDPTTHILTITGGSSAPDNNVDVEGLRHDSRDSLYRTPGGAVPADTEVRIRFRTFHNDVTGVTLRNYDLNAAGQQETAMEIVASDVSCYQEELEGRTCDYWEAKLKSEAPNNYWYRFIVTDGSDTAYYADNTAALDGGVGAATDDVVDNSYALMFYDPAFTSPIWAKGAVVYQIFPDRFRNGRANNDPQTGDSRYNDPVLSLPWNTLPEGYCRAYDGAQNNCAWRFASPGSGSIEQPRGRDYFGGDLKGVDQQMEYLSWLGVNTIYFNPIFDLSSNHGYDTRDFSKISPYFGTQKDWENLVKHANQTGVRLILDGVFNHLSSDSPFFDRYHRYSIAGGCESSASVYRSWFGFRQPGPTEPAACAPTAQGGNDTFYNGWFGFDSLPVITKSLPSVQQYFLTDQNSVTKSWLKQGAAGWRLDVMGDASFPNGYWESFRQATKTTKSDALIIGELWQKDSTLLRFLRGDRADSTMNYRLRDAVLGFLAPQNFDSKGFADSGRKLAPSEFAARLQAIREDYPDAAYYSLMNLLDSHDTARLLWVLTPGANTREDREFNNSNLAEGKLRQQLASLIQFAVPGSPTIYYGDEVGVTGNDDPDDRRTYPWEDLGGSPDYALRDHYRSLITARKQNAALTSGDFRLLLANDTDETVAFGRKTTSRAALLIVNRSEQFRTVNIPVDSYFPNGLQFAPLLTVGNITGASFTTSGGMLQVSLDPKSGTLLATGQVDLNPPTAPANLHVTSESSGQVALEWSPVSGAASYNVYSTPVSGGGYKKENSSTVTGTNFTVTGLQNGVKYFFVVTALDAPGNEGKYSNEIDAVPHLQIGWANLQWPPTITHTISAVNRTENAYGQIWIDGVTNQTGPTPSVRAQLGFGPGNSDPNGNTSWTWIDAAFNSDAGNNDEFVASMLPSTTGAFDYAYRYSTTNGRNWTYADLDGIGNGYSPAQAGKMTVNASSDTTVPVAPANLSVTSATASRISLAWDAVVGDPTLYGYELLRGTTAGGPYTLIATVTGTTYNDSAVVTNHTYFYVVRAVDQSFNRSQNSNEVSAEAKQRKVSAMFNLTVPATTDGVGQAVRIAGTLDRLDGGLPQWDPGAVQLTRVDATHWTITLTGNEGTALEYKYTLGSWDFVEKGGACEEIGNRLLTLTYGANGQQAINDTVLNWRTVAPCGN